MSTNSDKVDPGRVRQWLDDYLTAWTSNAPGDVERLFTPDAEYRFRPYAEPLRGRDAIIAGWLESKDEPGSWTARFEPLAVDGDLVIAVGAVDYDNGDSYSNMWVIRFDADGRCASFTEWWMQRPAASK